MTIQSTVTPDGNNCSIFIKKDKFVFDCHGEFRNSYENLNDSVKKIEVDMRKVNYIDSSAIGMLLLLQEFADKHGKKLQVNNCCEYVYKILSLAQLENVINFSRVPGMSAEAS
jgi:anti-anti-sigma factor